MIRFWQGLVLLISLFWDFTPRRRLLAILALFPLQMIKVIGLIHWQALKLTLKGVPRHAKPAPLVVPVS